MTSQLVIKGNDSVYAFFSAFLEHIQKVLLKKTHRRNIDLIPMG